MKTRKMAFAALACLCLVSCKWFTRNDREPVQKNLNPVIGKWLIDSVHISNDSNIITVMGLSSVMEDNTPLDFHFTPDSIFFYSDADVEREAYRFDKEKSQVIVNDAKRTIYEVHKVNDSTITLATADSTVLFLKKK